MHILLKSWLCRSITLIVSHQTLAVTLPVWHPSPLHFQEKKGAPAQDPAEREKMEIAKLEKLLSMVRDPPPEAKTNWDQESATEVHIPSVKS